MSILASDPDAGISGKGSSDAMVRTTGTAVLQSMAITTYE